MSELKDEVVRERCASATARSRAAARLVAAARRPPAAAAAKRPAMPDSVGMQAAQMGYSTQELGSVPEGANLGLGCGNPQAIAALKPGESVLDLGSGAGFDCFLAARQVGAAGKVIGVDMTPEMVAKARAQRAQGQSCQCRIPPRRDRAPAARRRLRRRHHLELRNQSFHRQAGGLPRGVSRAEARRAARRVRRRRHRAAAAGNSR